MGLVSNPSNPPKKKSYKLQVGFLKKVVEVGFLKNIEQAFQNHLGTKLQNSHSFPNKPIKIKNHFLVFFLDGSPSARPPPFSPSAFCWLGVAPAFAFAFALGLLRRAGRFLLSGSFSFFGKMGLEGYKQTKE